MAETEWLLLPNLRFEGLILVLVLVLIWPVIILSVRRATIVVHDDVKGETR